MRVSLMPFDSETSGKADPISLASQSKPSVNGANLAELRRGCQETAYWHHTWQGQERTAHPAAGIPQTVLSTFSVPSLIPGELGLVFCVILSHNNLMNIIQKMLKDYYEIIEYDSKRICCHGKHRKRSSTMGSHLTVAPYMAALIAEILRSFLSVVAPSFCPTYGAKYSDDRSTAMSFKLISVPIGILSIPLTNPSAGFPLLNHQVCVARSAKLSHRKAERSCYHAFHGGRL